MARPKKIVADPVEESNVAVLDKPEFSPAKEERKIFIPKSKKELCYEKLKPFIDEEGHKLVRGRFRNYETPGGNASIQVRKYPEEFVKPFNKVMIDNVMYEIPLYVARFLNGVDVTSPLKRIDTCSYGVHGFQWEDGKSAPSNSLNGENVMVPIVAITKRVRRYGFESMEFDSLT